MSTARLDDDDIGRRTEGGAITWPSTFGIRPVVGMLKDKLQGAGVDYIPNNYLQVNYGVRQRRWSQGGIQY